MALTHGHYCLSMVKVNSIFVHLALFVQSSVVSVIKPLRLHIGKLECL
jgi:hypothetical protein